MPLRLPPWPLVGLLLLVLPPATQAAGPDRPAPGFGLPLDVPFVATPQPVVEAMLALARVGRRDVVYDLGSGDGRIPITAARRYGARGVGIDINPLRVEEAREAARRAGVQGRVTFRQQDLFRTDLRRATVVTLYLTEELNLRLRPRLLAQLRPGTRVVSHQFRMGDWRPEQVLQVEGRTLYLWVIPRRRPSRQAPRVPRKPRGEARSC